MAYCAHGVTSSTPENSLPLKNDAGSQAEVLLESLKLELDRSLLVSTFHYLLMSKHGLSVAELSSLLMTPAIKDSGQSYHHRKIVQFLHHLRCRLTPQCIQTVVSGDRTLLRLQHPTFAAVVRHFLLGDEEEDVASLQEVHRASLTAYWEAAESRYGPWINHRKLEELPHLCGAPLDRFVFDWDWTFLKICGCQVDELLEDIEEADVSAEQRTEIDFLVDFLHSASLALNYDGRQFYSQVHARMALPTDAETNMPHLYALLESCQNCLPTTSLLCPAGAGCLMPCATPVAEQLPEVGRKGALTSLHRVKGNPSFVVSLCTSQDEVVVWNVYEQQAERRLQGVTQPRDIKFIDEHTAVILCNRELCIYDLNEGKFLVKLKGVMNQKMPYYDLHDGDHVVSLSRNRMYVNMTNLTSGDCVATFKVGEDRFLNSLLVSANGRICVCGDETQKPFPLLVWDLSSRKLLYDLRIPHHDFVTNLSAITNDGHYVVCVCQVGIASPRHFVFGNVELRRVDLSNVQRKFLSAFVGSQRSNSKFHHRLRFAKRYLVQEMETRREHLQRRHLFRRRLRRHGPGRHFGFGLGPHHWSVQVTDTFFQPLREAVEKCNRPTPPLPILSSQEHSDRSYGTGHTNSNG